MPTYRIYVEGADYWIDINGRLFKVGFIVSLVFWGRNYLDADNRMARYIRKIEILEESNKLRPYAGSRFQAQHHEEVSFLQLFKKQSEISFFLMNPDDAEAEEYKGLDSE